MASLVDGLKLVYQKYEKENQEGKDSLGTLFQFLEMAVCTYVKLNAQQDDWDKEEAIFDEQVTLVGEGKEKEKKEKTTLRLGKTTKKEKNKVKRGYYVGKQQKGGKQNKRGVERQGGKEDKEKNKQGRKEGMRGLNGGEQDAKKQKSFRDNG